MLCLKRWLLLALCAFSLAGQTGQGIITGTVTDSSGAAVPNVNIRLSGKETGFNYTTVTNTEGLYRAPYLNPGFYTVTDEVQGFEETGAERNSGAVVGDGAAGRDAGGGFGSRAGWR
jgi:hypothetical protein